MIAVLIWWDVERLRKSYQPDNATVTYDTDKPTGSTAGSAAVFETDALRRPP